MVAIGLTGGIGSGKSSIARILKQIGYPVYISDSEAKCLMNTHTDIRTALIARFGSSVYTSDGELNKSFLSQIIFNDPLALAEINSIVHPRVMEDFQEWSNCQKSALVFFESAILFEANLDHLFAYTICVTASESTRIQRIIDRDKLTLEQIKERMDNQLDNKTKCQKANFIIHNDEQDMVIQQVLNITIQISRQK